MALTGCVGTFEEYVFRYFWHFESATEAERCRNKYSLNISHHLIFFAQIVFASNWYRRRNGVKYIKIDSQQLDSHFNDSGGMCFVAITFLNCSSPGLFQ